MRDHLAKAERHSAEWENLDEQHKRRTGDPGRLFLNKQRDIGGICSEWDAMKFHREHAMMYASIIQAEEAAMRAAGYLRKEMS